MLQYSKEINFILLNNLFFYYEYNKKTPVIPKNSLKSQVIFEFTKINLYIKNQS